MAEMITAEPGRGTKGARVFKLLKRPEGATIAEIAEAIRWKRPSVRSYLSGLKGEGHDIRDRYEDTDRVYYIPQKGKRGPKPQPAPEPERSTVDHIAACIVRNKGADKLSKRDLDTFVMAAAKLAVKNPLMMAGIEAEAAMLP